MKVSSRFVLAVSTFTLFGCAGSDANVQLAGRKAAFISGVWTERTQQWAKDCEAVPPDKRTHLERSFCGGVLDAQRALESARNEALAFDQASQALEGKLLQMLLKIYGGGR